MPEHYTRNTVECTAWCNRCGGQTQHRVDGGRRGPCLQCMERQRLANEVERIRKGLEEEQRAELEGKQGKLFEGEET